MTELNHDLPDTDSYNPAASSLAGHVDPAVMAELLSIRSSIDNIDATLVYLLAERFKATQKVGFLRLPTVFRRGIPDVKPPRLPGSDALPRTPSWTPRLRKSS